MPLCPTTSTLRERLAGKRAAADRRLGLRRQGRAGPDRARAAGDARSRCCCAATPSSASQNQVLTTRPVRGPRRQRASRPSAATSATTASTVAGGIDIVIHCAASRLLRADAGRGARAQRQGPGAPAARRCARPAATRTSSTSPPPTPRASAPGSCSRSRRAPRRREPWLDLNAELDAARAWRRDIEAESRLPQHQHRFVKEAERAVGPAGGPAIGTRAEILRYEWVRDQLVERGRERARALGWSDTYTLSKAIGERTLIAANPRQLTIVRPAIVESALTHALPGLDGVAEGRRPDPARLRRRHHPRPLRRQPRDPDGPDPGRLRRQRLRRGRRASRPRTAPCAR